jgi:hypothetical protein
MNKMEYILFIKVFLHSTHVYLVNLKSNDQNQNFQIIKIIYIIQY